MSQDGVTGTFCLFRPERNRRDPPVMPMHRRRSFLAVPTAALFVASLATAGCSKPRELYVDHAWVRLPAVPHQPAAAYFTIHGGAVATTLIDVSSDIAIRSEMHETMRGAGPGAMTRMTPLKSVAIPAKSVDAFAPGGRHVMLFDLDPSAKRGAALALTFTFGNGERVLQTAQVLGAGDPPPKE